MEEDGPKYVSGQRVELHPSMDLWMKGDRFGEVKSIMFDRRIGKYRYTVLIDKSDKYVVIHERDIFKALE